MVPNCSCIRGNYNFWANPLDQKVLRYEDRSDWMTEGQYEVPEEYDVSILPAGKSKFITLTLKVGQQNFINATDLGYLGKLKDGIYCFQVTSCGREYKRIRGFTPDIDCCIKQAYATLSDKYFDQLREIEQYLNTFKNDAELQKVIQAEKSLRVATKLLENLKCDCHC